MFPGMPLAPTKSVEEPGRGAKANNARLPWGLAAKLIFGGLVLLAVGSFLATDLVHETLLRNGTRSHEPLGPFESLVFLAGFQFVLGAIAAAVALLALRRWFLRSPYLVSAVCVLVGLLAMVPVTVNYISLTVGCAD